MTPLSGKLALAVAVLALLAAAPIWWHRIAAPLHEPCPGISSLYEAERIGGWAVTERGARPKTGEDFIDGALDPLPANVAFMTFRIVRGFDPETFFGRSLLNDFGDNRIRELSDETILLERDGERIPIHWVENRQESKLRMRGFFYVYDGRPVASPFAAGVASAWSQLVSGTKPFTFFAVGAFGRDATAEAMRESTQQWLVDAWRQYRDACSAP